MTVEPWVLRSARRLASGDVEIQAVTSDLRTLVVVVPFARSTFNDIDHAVRQAIGHLPAKKRHQP